MRDVALRDIALDVVGMEYGRTVLGADITALAIELGRIMGNGKKHLQQLPVADLSRVVDDADHLGMAGGIGTDGLVIGGVCTAAAIA